MKTLKVRFLHDNGEISEVANIRGYENFREFASTNVNAQYSIYDDICIDMNKVVKFWEVIETK